MLDNEGQSAPETVNPTTEQTTPETAATDGAAPAQVDGTSADGKPADVKPDWPEDWRDKLAGGDEKERKILDRFQSPKDILKSFRALQAKQSSGELKEKLPEKATEEQIAAYRKDNGIPEKPDGYLEKLPNGLVIGDEDKPLVASFLEAAHAKNADPAVVAEAVDWYYRQQEQIIADRAQADKEYKTKADDELRAEWGGEYRGNINSIMAFLDTAPTTEDGKPLKELILGGRLADGTAIGNNPAALRWLAKLANDANPAGFISPGAGTSQIDGVEAEIATIETKMRTDRAAYDKDAKMQARLLTLYSAREKLAR